MMKKIRYIPLFCLLLCLFLAGCGERAADDADDGAGETIGVHDTDSKQTGIDTGRVVNPEVTQPPVETSAKIETEPAPETTIPVTEPVPETTIPVTEPVTDKAPETTAPPVETEAPEMVSEDIDLTGTLSPGKPVTGQFVSQQSEKLQLVVNYSCHMEETGGVFIEFEVGLQAYDIHCGARTDMGKITVNDVTHTFSTAEIVHEERDRVYVPFTSYVYQSEAGDASCRVDASWVFNGTYGGTKIDALTAGATLRWAAPAPAEAGAKTE